jgi:phosphatidylglycerol---prolipoprotein diacylglyceryl transferase
LSATVLPLFIPSPSQGVWHVGPFPIRGYALCIILGVVAAIWVGERRWPARGGVRGQVSDIAIWAVPFGLVGGRLYHVITDPARYFGSDGDPIAALYVWQGGLGIWGAIALGGVGAWIGCRRMGIKLPPLADALAPGIVLAQAIGRWGNWFNQELYGKPTTLPWGLKIDEQHRVPGYERFETFHPTYLYECLWDLGTAGLVIWADRRFRLGHGRAFALYVMAYTAGRGWIEALRIDTVEANDVFGLRLNVWTSIVVFLGAAAYFVVMGRLRPGREESVWREGREPGHLADERELEPEGERDSEPTGEARDDEPGNDDEPGDDEGRQPGPAGRSGEPDLR